ncbi:hypothetical protein RHSIM_Rhsim04G0154600 [Rhododendron simsii]|uniref:GDSL esterase/lipase n=1 Tax=Rhododendron simsii TaxID=118357 RepID=A0A834H3T7_RHOSS|nr:hypothetical protein RHSIM_Rhsim04G0154600 [Rhododendron simsii]
MHPAFPFLIPTWKKMQTSDMESNFAVGGATALPAKFLTKKNIVNLFTNSSLKLQLDWMSKHLDCTVRTIEGGCLEKQKTSLFVLGEIGANDYGYALIEGKTMQEIKNLVPEVVAAIISGVRRVIMSYGAVRVAVPGIFANGCFPIFLTLYQTNNSSAYDKHGCLKEINSFAYYHNKKLQEAIQGLKREYPDVIIVYVDYNRAFEWLYDHAVHLGFDSKSTQKACCGIGGVYNFDFINLCSSEFSVCPNPNQFISWDGILLTKAAYKRMAEWLIDDMLPKLQCCV